MSNILDIFCSNGLICCETVNGFGGMKYADFYKYATVDWFVRMYGITAEEAVFAIEESLRVLHENN